MILTDPVVNPVILFVGLIVIAGAVIFEMIYDPWRSRRAVILNIVSTTLILASLFFMNLRPYFPGVLEGGETGVEAEYKDIDVIFVVDSTLSMKANDTDQGQRRHAVIADAKKILEELPGCSSTVISFDNQAKVAVPFTTDTVSVEDAFETMYPPDSFYAQGTDLSLPFTEVSKSLQRRAQHDGRKMTLLFFMSDGENTSGGKIPNASSLAPYIDGGSVIGYGTAKGATMDDGFGQKIQDPKTYGDAISKLDEGALRNVAGQLGIEYVSHDDVDDAVKKAKVLWDAAPVYSGTSMLNAAHRTELYYYFAIPLIVGIGIWMCGASRENAKATRVLGKGKTRRNG